MKCPRCDTEMKPLATGEFCPRDCDRIPLLVTNEDDEPTHPFVTLRPGVIDPNCRHLDIAPFEVRGELKHHCWDCGVVL